MMTMLNEIEARKVLQSATPQVIVFRIRIDRLTGVSEG